MTFLEDLLRLNSNQTAAEIASDIFGGLSHIQSGVSAKRAADFQAAQIRQNAGQVQASAQREAANVDRQAQYVASAALASAAASGGGASDPTVVNLIARNASEMAYRKSVALYEGDDKARAMALQAAATEYSGKAAKAQGVVSGLGSIYKAKTSLLTGQAREASLLERFGGGGPNMKVE